MGRKKKAMENWKTILEKLKIQLETPMPEKKKYRKKACIVCNPWEIGDVYAYQFSTEYSKDKNLYGKYILFQKIGDSDWCNETYSRVYIFDKLFDELPQLSEIKTEELRILPMDLPERFFSKNKEDILPLNMNALMIIYKKGDYPEKNLTYLGNTKTEIRTPNYQNRDIFSWYRLEEDPLCDYYWEWQRCEYTNENGEYYVIV